ncbi:APC family permease [Symmachiella dynata]|uniref:APC family permease n=1 Tax=Symmachiella dynata TaxID=2527995 RepID=UPI0030ECE325
MKQSSEKKLSLLGSVSLGTGVMIGAGIFVLMGQIAELVGGLFPLAFLVGAIVVGFSAYSYVKFSNAYPSSGGVAMFMRKAYGPGTMAGTFSLLMYVSMVIAESLVARTFGSYTLRLFNVENTAMLVPTLGVLLIAVAYIINISGNKIIESTANLTAAVKIVGIAVLALAGLAVAGFPSAEDWGRTDQVAATGGSFNFVAALALAILAFKGFTTITNQGADISDPHRNLGRSIILSILICTVIYTILAFSVSSSLSVEEVITAKDYALAAAARPVFGEMGLLFTVLLAIVATVSGLIASVFSASRMLAMLSDMKQLPQLYRGIENPALILTVALAIGLTVLFDLTRIASIGAIFYLIMDIAIHWGLFRHLLRETKATPIIPVIAILLDVIILGAFLLLKYESDSLVIIVSLVGFVAILIAQRLFMVTHTDSAGVMHMEMGGAENMAMGDDEKMPDDMDMSK